MASTKKKSGKKYGKGKKPSAAQRQRQKDRRARREAQVERELRAASRRRTAHMPDPQPMPELLRVSSGGSFNFTEVDVRAPGPPTRPESDIVEGDEEIEGPSVPSYYGSRTAGKSRYTVKLVFTRRSRPDIIPHTDLKRLAQLLRAHGTNIAEAHMPLGDYLVPLCITAKSPRQAGRLARRKARELLREYRLGDSYKLARKVESIKSVG